MKKIDPRNLDFHQFVDDIHKAIEEIERDNLLDLSHPDKLPAVVLCELLEKNRMSIQELLELIRIPKDNN